MPHLRIRIESQRVGGAAIVHDQRRRRAGWTPGEAGKMLFRPPRPMTDGWYEWSAELWDGVTWSAAGRRLRFRVDTVPPAPVVNLRASGDPERRVVRLEWDPSPRTRAGGRVRGRLPRYRYPRPDEQRFVEVYEVGRTEDTRIELPYDLAGGETGPWFLASPRRTWPVTRPTGRTGRRPAPPPIKNRGACAPRPPRRAPELVDHALPCRTRGLLLALRAADLAQLQQGLVYGERRRVGRDQRFEDRDRAIVLPFRHVDSASMACALPASVGAAASDARRARARSRPRRRAEAVQHESS